MGRAVERGNLQELVAGFGREAMDSSLAANTTATQSSAMKAWVRFCEITGVRADCGGYSLEETEGHVVAFIGFEVGLRGMSPSSIKRTYLAAIASGFVKARVRNEFRAACKSEWVRFLLRGYINIYARMHPASETKKLAFTIELVKFAKVAMKSSGHRRREERLFLKAVTVAMTFGIYFLLRKSEYLPGHSAGSFRGGMRWKRVRFFNQEGGRIPWSSVRLGTARWIQINVVKSKTDQLGFGRLVKHEVVHGEDCIVKKMEVWATYCRTVLGAGEEDYLFRVGGAAPLVSDHDVAYVMKAIVSHLGWNSGKVSAHSLRYGGATMLAAAGLPQYVIAYFGGWTEDSSSLKHYTQVGGESVARVSKIMSMGFKRSLEESRIRSSQE